MRMSISLRNCLFCIVIGYKNISILQKFNDSFCDCVSQPLASGPFHSDWSSSLDSCTEDYLSRTNTRKVNVLFRTVS